MAKIVSVFVAALLICLGALYWIGKMRDERARQARRAAEEQKVKESITHFGATYNAVQNWRDGLNSGDLSSPAYSFQLQQALVRDASRPVLFVGEVHDIASTGNSMLCEFDVIAGLRWDIRFFLSCDQKQANYLAQQPLGGLRQFAVIAELKAASTLERASAEEKDDRSDPKFRADGRLVDSMFVGNYVGDLMDALSRKPSLNRLPSSPP